MAKTKNKLVQMIILFLLSSFALAENEVTVTSTIKHKCSRNNLKWDIGSVTMQNIAYAWTHQQKIDSWEYQEDTSRPVPMTVNNFPEPQCRRIQYNTVVQVPEGFTQYFAGKYLRTHISKKVCATSKDLIEDVEFSNIVLIGSFKINMSASIDNQKKETVYVSKCDVVLPWLAIPLKSLIYKHIKSSMLEYIDLLSNSLC